MKIRVIRVLMWESAHREWQCLAYKLARPMEPQWEGTWRRAGRETETQSQREQSATGQLNPRAWATTKDGLCCKNNSPLGTFSSGWFLRVLSLAYCYGLERAKAEHKGWEWYCKRMLRDSGLHKDFSSETVFILFHILTSCCWLLHWKAAVGIIWQRQIM